MPYVLVSQAKIYEETFAKNRPECWAKGFEIVASELGDEWRKKYWKRWEPSMRSARANGYWIERAEISLK